MLKFSTSSIPGLSIVSHCSCVNVGSVSVVRLSGANVKCIIYAVSFSGDGWWWLGANAWRTAGVAIDVVFGFGFVMEMCCRLGGGGRDAEGEFSSSEPEVSSVGNSMGGPSPVSLSATYCFVSLTK